METRYGIDVGNRYALFLDSDDEVVENDVPKKPVEATGKPAKADSKVNGAPNAAKKEPAKNQTKGSNREGAYKLLFTSLICYKRMAWSKV